MSKHIVVKLRFFESYKYYKGFKQQKWPSNSLEVIGNHTYKSQEQLFTHKWSIVGAVRHVVGDDELKNGERQENRDLKRDLFAALGWKQEYKQHECG